MSDASDGPDSERNWLPILWKRAADAIALAFYLCGGDYRKLSARMRDCGSFFEYDCYRVDDNEEIVRRVVHGSLCRIRLCFLCERALSRKRGYQLWRIFRTWFARRPSDQAVLLTLTIKSEPDARLAWAVGFMLAGLRRLTRGRRFKFAVRAWYRTLEVTRNAETGLWHVHAHLLLVVSRRYFWRPLGLYIDQPEWAALWRKFAQLDYEPVVDVRALKGVGGGPIDDLGRKSLLEVSKYCTKPSDLVGFDDDGEPTAVEPETLKTLYDALKGRRLVGMSAALRAVARELELDDPDDDRTFSVAEDVPHHTEYLGREVYRWHQHLRDYVGVPRGVWNDHQKEEQMD